MESYFLWHNIVFFLCMCKEQSKSLSIARWKTTIGAINKGNKTWMIHRSMKVYFEYTKIFLWWFFSILQKMFWFFFSQIPFLINHFPKYLKKNNLPKTTTIITKNMKRCLIFFLISQFECHQIWQNVLKNDCHMNNIAKFKTKITNYKHMWFIT